MSFKDYFSGHASDYQKYRPNYPADLFEYLAAIAPGHDLAWDCATGNGQAALGLAPYFQQVIATDASREQIASAAQHAGVEYRVSPAERTDLAAGGVDLVTVAQAAHWFDRPKFYHEVRRVARPGGLLAVWCYELMTITPEIDAVGLRLYRDTLDSFWPPERRLIEEGYRTIEFPFVELSPPPFKMQLRWTLREAVGYLCTWSAVKAYEKQHGVNPLTLYEADFERAWGDPHETRLVTWPLNVRVGRVE